MGCLHSIAKKKCSCAEHNNDRNVSLFPETESGQINGLTEKQIFLLKQSWKGIKREMEETGVEMFMRLFLSNNNIQKMFNKLKDIKQMDDLRGSEAMYHHAVMVMDTLDDAIMRYENSEYFTDRLHKVAATHANKSEFRPETFMTLREPFLEAVQMTLGDRYSDNMKIIYGIAINAILETMVTGLIEELKKLGESSSDA